MTEWTVVTVIIALAGLVALLIKPYGKLINILTTLTTSVANIEGKLTNFDTNNSAAHKRLWEKNEKQDSEIADHAARLHELDGK